jgi:hypothetical protein
MQNDLEPDFVPAHPRLPRIDSAEQLLTADLPPRGLSYILASLSPDGIPDLGKREGQKAFEQCWKEPPELLVLDNISCLVGMVTDDPDSWNTLQAWLLDLRRRGISVLMVHHAGKDGSQRGTSRREDVLDTVLALALPLFQAGLSLREVAKELGISKSACHRLRLQAMARGLVGRG